MKSIFILLVVMLLQACSTVSLNNANSLTDDEKVIFWSHQDILRPLYIASINGKELPKLYAPKIADTQGKKILQVELYHSYKSADDLEIVVEFHFEIEAKAGNSYNFKIDGASDFNFSVNNDVKLCIYEEPHKAEGSSINITGEYRTPSSFARKLGCSAATYRPFG